MKIAEEISQQSAKVAVGSRVEMLVNGRERVCDIVHPWEADFNEGKFSCEAPLIKLILGLEEEQKMVGGVNGNEAVVEVSSVKSLALDTSS